MVPLGSVVCSNVLFLPSLIKRIILQVKYKLFFKIENLFDYFGMFIHGCAVQLIILRATMTRHFSTTIKPHSLHHLTSFFLILVLDKCTLQEATQTM